MATRTDQERASIMESYGSAYKQLEEAMSRFPKECWQFRPSPDIWTIHEILVHITDSEANSYTRCRRAIAEPGQSVMAYDEMQWAKALNYGEQSPEDAAQLFKWLRSNTYKLIKTLPSSAWSNAIYHPENGTMTLDDWLDVYERHVSDHVSQMEENYLAWQAERDA